MSIYLEMIKQIFKILGGLANLRTSMASMSLLRESQYVKALIACNIGMAHLMPRKQVKYKLLLLANESIE